jgi:hypothetical protein
MEKIITLFQRNYDGDRRVRDEVVPGAEWVLAGEGVATEKLDGTGCLVRDGKLYKRYELKQGKKPPANFEPVTPVDPITGKQQGWVPVGEGPEDRWHREAFERALSFDYTYELVGPKVQGNPYGYQEHWLVAHGGTPLPDVPRDYAGIRAYLAAHAIEGIVWWRDVADPECDKVKIKRRDFGLPWPVKESV